MFGRDSSSDRMRRSFVHQTPQSQHPCLPDSSVRIRLNRLNITMNRPAFTSHSPAPISLVGYSVAIHHMVKRTAVDVCLFRLVSCQSTGPSLSSHAAAPAGSLKARGCCAHPARHLVAFRQGRIVTRRGEEIVQPAAQPQNSLTKMDQLRRAGAGHMHPTKTPVFPMKEHLQEAAVTGIDRRRHLQQRDARRHEVQGRRCPSYSVAAIRCAPCPSARSTRTRALPLGRRLLRSLA